MKYAEEKRIRFIDYLLSQYGYFNRSAIANFFAIAPSQVTKDIATYKKLAPANMFFNDSEKLYYKTNSFKPLYK